MKKALDFYLEQRRKMLAFNYLNFVTSWDFNTDAAGGSIEADAKQLEVFDEMLYNMQTSKEYVDAVDTLYVNREKLDSVLAHEVTLVRKSIDQTRKIPVKEYLAFRQLVTNAVNVYVQAKTNNDFELFRPYLEKIVDYVRKQNEWLKTDTLSGYNIHLDKYEPNFPQSKFDEFFDVLKQKLVPFVQKATAQKLDDDFAFGSLTYDVDKQRQFSEYLREVLCFDKSRGIMKISEHPFTSGFGTDDVRITTHFYPDNLVSAIFSTIHETGHALYQQQIDPALNSTFLCDGASMGMHESQSRFFENVIGRSLEFWQVHFAKLQEFFPQQLGKVSVEQFVRFVNRAELSFVRIEADELTYPLHIMLRYEMEKKFVNGELEVADFPKYWNDSFKQYFGIVPQSDKEGVLQDIHWAGGDVGYFPTYALGSAISSQLFAAMNKDFDVLASLADGTTKRINEWLKQHVHKFGQSKYTMDIVKNACGEDFNPNYYVDYLIAKYSKLYGIN